MRLALNENFNSNHSNILGFGMSIVTLIVSIPLSKFVTWPIKKLFMKLSTDKSQHNHAVGSICEIESDVNDKHGRAIVRTGTSPLGIMVMCEEGKSISKGSKAVVLEFDKKSNRYLVAEVEDDIFNDIEKK